MSDEPKKKRGKLFAGGAAIVIVTTIAGGLVTRRNAMKEQAVIAESNALPTVNIVRPRASQAGELILPGDVQALNRAQINPRTSGYVRRWFADIGDTVRAGQTLAVLDAPEISQQLRQAQADYNSAVANRQLAGSTAERWRALQAKDAVSKQETDEKIGRLATARAAVDAAAANVARLEEIRGFTELKAPFSGVVTSRNAQIGALVGPNTNNDTALFTLADVSRMRVYVRVPQNLTTGLTKGIHAEITIPELPGHIFDGVFVRSADGVDRRSGTVLAEFRVTNPDNRLRPGSYASVRLPVKPGEGTYQLPAGAIIFGSAGPMVALADSTSKVTLRRVTIGRDQGKTIEISAGLKPDDRVIETPPDGIADGDAVRIASSTATKGDHHANS